MGGMTGGGKGGGGSGGGGGGFNPDAMFANQAMPGMYGGDPSAMPQFADASAFTNPLDTMSAAFGGDQLPGGDFSGTQPWPGTSDIGGTQSDPNAPQGAQPGGGTAQTSPLTGIPELAKILGQQNKPEAPQQQLTGTPGGETQPSTSDMPNQTFTSRWGPSVQPPSPTLGPMAGQAARLGAQPLPGAAAAPPQEAAQPPAEAPAQPPPPAPSEPQPAAVTPAVPRRQEPAATAPATPPAPAAGGQPPPPSQDPISQFLHALGLDALIPQAGGNYNIPEASRRNQQYGLGDILRRAGNVANVMAGRPTVSRRHPQQPGMAHTAYAPEPGAETSPWSPYYGGRAPQAAGVGGSYNPQTYTRALWNIEGGGRTGSNVGRAQFGPEEIRRYGNPNDPASVQREVADHSRILRSALGRDPAPWELYLTHQQGRAGGPALLKADPNMPAWQAIRRFYRSDAIAKSAIHGNLYGAARSVPAENITVGQFNNWWKDRFNRELTRVGGGQTVAQTGATRNFTGGGATSTAYEGHVPTDEELSSARQAPDGNRYVKRGNQYFKVIEDREPAADASP